MAAQGRRGRVARERAGRRGAGGRRWRDARLVTRGGAALVQIEVCERMRPGHVSLPNGLGLDNAGGDGALRRTGVAPNELTLARDRDEFAGTPWHKFVPARLEEP